VVRGAIRWPLIAVGAAHASVCLAADAISERALIAAGQAAPLSRIDDRRRACGDDRRFEVWLKSVVGGSARLISWSGGRCRLVNRDNPIDSGGGWCAQAEITPKHGRDNATVEVYFETPKGGIPGEPFAFQAVVHTRDGWDYMRETSAFAANWRETYAPDQPAPKLENECD
jgi:hypothetical protein